MSTTMSTAAKVEQQGDKAMGETQENALMKSTLLRLSRGLPKRELKLIIGEADQCEAELLKDIQALERELDGKDEITDADADAATVNEVLESLLTPLDRYWTLSALLGRLRGDLQMPSLLSVAPGGASLSLQQQQISPTSTANASALVALLKNPAYTKKHTATTDLLATWKKITSHRSALVFKKPVKPEDAPGYTDRIAFPMDLSLIRKMIVAHKVVRYAELHQYVGLIGHNCVKYNGRESEYAAVAREFEATADRIISEALPAAAATVATMTTPVPLALPVPASSAVLATAAAAAGAAPVPANPDATKT